MHKCPNCNNKIPFYNIRPFRNKYPIACKKCGERFTVKCQTNRVLSVISMVLVIVYGIIYGVLGAIIQIDTKKFFALMPSVLILAIILEHFTKIEVKK